MSWIKEDINNWLDFCMYTFLNPLFFDQRNFELAFIFCAERESERMKLFRM